MGQLAKQSADNITEDDRYKNMNPEPNSQSNSRESYEGKRRRRLPIPGILVAIDAPDIGSHPWVVDAIDINAQGIGLVLPPELPEGTEVLLSFRLGDENELAQVPATVRHRDGTSGGVKFEAWQEADRLHLLEFLIDAYEQQQQ